MHAQDLRSNVRYGCTVPIMCRRGTAFEHGQTRDISENGIGLISQKFIPKNSKLILEIALAPATEPLMALGKVKWVEKMGYSEMYRLGLQFENLSVDTQKRLSKFFRGTV
ncbi:PilZ domain-containing protein [Candidatus Omnitrophota bacterium]